MQLWFRWWGGITLYVFAGSACLLRGEYGQGYHFARPVPAEEARASLPARSPAAA